MASVAMSFPIGTGQAVTTAHVRYCEENGHATATRNGENWEVLEVLPYCPRCGANRPQGS